MKTFKDMRNIINEALSKADPIDKWISDFVNSDDPKFATKSKKERIEMAKGAYYGAQKEGVMQPNGTDKVGSIKEVDKSTNKDLAKACWKGYTAVGTKKKNGKTVPNCVPEEVKEGKDIPKGYHKMPDGTIMKDSEHKTENVKVNPNARETETQNASDKKSKAKASYNQTVQKIKGMRMQEENKKGFLQGAEAAKTGKKYSENPHPKGSAEHLQWSKGHNQHRANKLTNESEIKDKKDNLPPHIKALMKKVSGKTMPSSKPTMKDVTPKGYGPNEEAEVDESTASKIVGNKLKNMNLQYRIPTPAERKAMFDKEQADKKAKEANKTIKKESHMLGFNDFIKESSCGTTKKVKEMEEANQTYTAVHVKHGSATVQADSSYGAAKKAASQWNTGKKGTQGIDVHLHTDKPKAYSETVKHPNQKALDVDGDGEIEASDLKALRDKKKSKEVNELNKSTLKSYADKAHQDSMNKAYDAAHTGDSKESDKLHKQAVKRADNVKKADMKASMKNEEAEMDESITPQLVKQGIGIAKDKRYAGGNMTGATKAMDKLHPKLQHHPKVASALKTQNEEAEMDESYEKGRGSTGVAFAIKKGHPDAENPATRKKYPERQTPEYKAQWASKHKGTMHEASTDHQHKIARDTVKNPNKSLLGGPSAKEAEEILRKKYGYNDHKINKLKEDFDLEESTPVSFNKFKSMVEKYTGADRQADAKAKRESDPNYAYSDHYGRKAKSDSANRPKSTVHKGTYGTSYDGDDEKQAKPETTDKRGRGRPSGSKSGARNKGAGVHDGGIPVHNLNLPNNRR